jgi:hypothetical protein
LLLAIVLFTGIALAASTEAVVTAEALAADTDAAAAPAPKTEVKKPTSLFEYGFEERVRAEAWNNIFNYRDTTANRAANYDERLQVRFRTKAWFKVPTKHVDFYLRIGNEFRHYITPDDRTVIGTGIPRVGNNATYALDFDEVFFDNLWIEIKKLGVPGLSLKIGRMDFSKGEGLLISDVSGVDGSRSAYHNMFNLAYKFRQGKSNLEVIGILDPREDRMLPTLSHTAPSSTLYSANRRMKVLVEYNVQTLGLYYTDKSNKKTDVEAYYFYVKQTDDLRAVTAANFLPDRRFSALGGRLTRRINKGLTAVGEFVGQWGAQHAAGTRPAADIRGWGGYGYAKKTFDHKFKPYFQAGWFALSGDDPSTPTRYEGFDPMFARTVKFGELSYYAFLNERGLGYWTNIHGPQIETGVKPHKRLGLKFVYWHKMAFQPYRGSTAVYNTTAGSKSRMDNIWFRADVPITKNFATHLTYEKAFPGNFYSGRNGAYFFRVEAIYSFKGSFLGSGVRK